MTSLSPRVSVLIVSFNTRDLTLAAIESVLRETHRVSIEIIVVDNNSTDGSADAITERFSSQVQLICSTDNRGFAIGNNIAAERASGSYLLLLNPDTVVLDGAIDRLVAFAVENPKHRIYGGRTVFEDGSLNPTSAWSRPTLRSMIFRGLGFSAIFKSSEFFNPEMMPGWDRGTSRSVDIVSGCFLLIDRDLWNQLGGFDPAFRLYAEEFDLCLRAKNLGAQPFVLSDSSIIHYGGRSDRVREDQTIRQFAARTMLFRKHWPRWKAGVAVRCLDAWAFNKLLRAAILRRREEVAAWRAICRRRSEWHFPDPVNHLRSSMSAPAE